MFYFPLSVCLASSAIQRQIRLDDGTGSSVSLSVYQLTDSAGSQTQVIPIHHRAISPYQPWKTRGVRGLVIGQLRFLGRFWGKEEITVSWINPILVILLGFVDLSTYSWKFCWIYTSCSVKWSNTDWFLGRFWRKEAAGSLCGFGLKNIGKLEYSEFSATVLGLKLNWNNLVDYCKERNSMRIFIIPVQSAHFSVFHCSFNSIFVGKRSVGENFVRRISGNTLEEQDFIQIIL